jgi:hypothetical protein
MPRRGIRKDKPNTSTKFVLLLSNETVTKLLEFHRPDSQQRTALSNRRNSTAVSGGVGAGKTGPLTKAIPLPLNITHTPGRRGRLS